MKVLKVIGFIPFYVRELLMANLRVAHDILTPRHRMKPGVIAIPLRVKSDGQIMALAHLITMTPGTLSLDLSKDRKTLYVHAMYVDDAEKIRESIQNGLEQRILEVTS